MTNAGKYLALEQYLERVNTNEVKLTFEDIEKIIKDQLPPSSHKYSAWWANGGHSQADAWLNAGWEIREVKLGEYVVFIKSKDRVRKQNVDIETGKIYKHFKGNYYLALHVAKDSETLEEMVVYKALYGERGIWVRPLKMFTEQIEIEGKLVSRFQEVEK